MNWKKIDINSVLSVLREIENNTPSLDCSQSIIYSDGIEELTISYKKLNSEQKHDK